ncbi:MAG: T9SS type A sorting domain-containing protein, partial [Bacteroidetes bacterium]|nr:T9SS type A sorting domain-containing protein [Bacteroidota bacterium]
PKPGDSTHIMFSMTSDGGQNWSQAIRIDETGGYCFDDDDAVEGAVPAVGPNGEVYVCWTGPLGLMFDRSVDSGKKWLEHDIKVSDVPGGWNYVIPGIYRANGLPVIACDTSGGNNHGTIYINWSDQRNGLDNTDIWLVKSTDGGNTWTQPTLVNNDNAVKQQFFTWMTIDQTSGFLYFVFYDRRNHDDEYTDVYLALSKNAGETFENHLISDSPFRPFPTVFFGDYTNISAHDGVVRPIWTRLDDTKLSVYTAIIDTSFTALPEIKNQDFVVENPSPNPFNSSSYLSFKLKKSSYVKLNVIDIFGRQVELMIDEQLPPGKYINHLDAEKHELKEGIYFYQLLVDKKLTSRKILFTN